MAYFDTTTRSAGPAAASFIRIAIGRWAVIVSAPMSTMTKTTRTTKTTAKAGVLCGVS